MEHGPFKRGNGPIKVNWLFFRMGKCEGTRLVVFPLSLTPAQAEEHHEPGPLSPFEPRTPSGRDPPPPSAPLREGARGEGSRLERESRPLAFSNCERFGRENTTSRVPPTSRDPLSLLTKVFQTEVFAWTSVRHVRAKMLVFFSRIWRVKTSSLG